MIRHDAARASRAGRLLPQGRMRSRAIERFGDEPTLADRAYCRIGDRVMVFELCEGGSTATT